MMLVPVMGAVVLVTIAAVVLFLWISLRVASARTRYGVAAPAMTGQPDFERAARVQANTLEQLVPFLAGLWLCALFLDRWAAVLLGLVWLLGRVWYALAYWRDASKRTPGFSIGFLATCLLLLGGAVGAVRLMLM